MARIELMNHSLREHIIGLEQKIQMLRDQLTKSHLSTSERSRIQDDIRTAELALSCFQEAFELEQSIS
jgi:hypothetical protein